MKIVEEHPEDYLTKKLYLVKAINEGDYVISLKFNDGKKIKIDFKQFLKRSQHPEIRKYLDISKFEQFRLIDGNLNWNDYDLIFPISDLYDGKL